MNNVIKCSKCLRNLKPNDFTLSKRNKNGLQGKCKVCQKKYRIDNKKKIAQLFIKPKWKKILKENNNV